MNSFMSKRTVIILVALNFVLGSLQFIGEPSYLGMFAAGINLGSVLYLPLLYQREQLSNGLLEPHQLKIKISGGTSMGAMNKFIEKAIEYGNPPITWTGGRCPTETNDTVILQHLNGTYSIGFASAYRWKHLGEPTDIIAYLVIYEGLT